MKNVYDITTRKGIKKAGTELNIKEILKTVWPVQMYIIESLAELLSAKSTIKEQKETAIAIIKAGKKNGLSKVRITLDQKAGLDINAPVEGVPVKVTLGKSGNMTIEAEYK